MSINRWMDKEAVVHIYNGLLLSHIKSFESVLARRINLEPITQSEVSQKEKQILYINAYMWNLEKLYR